MAGGYRLASWSCWQRCMTTESWDQLGPGLDISPRRPGFRSSGCSASGSPLLNPDVHSSMSSCIAGEQRCTEGRGLRRFSRWSKKDFNLSRVAPEAGLEPATRRLTAGCSTIELLWMPEGWQFTDRLPLRQTDSRRRFPLPRGALGRTQQKARLRNAGVRPWRLRPWPTPAPCTCPCAYPP
jgi:hypothetical protein